VLTLMLPARRLYRLGDVITTKHLDNMGKMLLTTGWIVTYSYIVEHFCAWYSGDALERYTYLVDRPLGLYAACFWTVVFCNCVVPQALWWKRVRTTPVFLWAACLFIQVGMWLERFMLIVTSQHAGFLPSSWADYRPSFVDIGILVGTISFFLFLFLLFLRVVPFIPIAELKELKHRLEREDREEAARA
jgi:Ni/Fe-hydrogenase subunit HybB-like protein